MFEPSKENEAMFAPMLQPQPCPTFAQVIATTNRSARFVRGVLCSRACCGGPDRDGVIVALGSADINRRRLAIGQDPAMRPIYVGVYDAHTNGAVSVAIIDKEDAKALVNHLSEAIAAAEAGEGV